MSTRTHLSSLPSLPRRTKEREPTRSRSCRLTGSGNEPTRRTGGRGRRRESSSLELSERTRISRSSSRMEDPTTTSNIFAFVWIFHFFESSLGFGCGKRRELSSRRGARRRVFLLPSREPFWSIGRSDIVQRKVPKLRSCRIATSRFNHIPAARETSLIQRKGSRARPFPSYSFAC